MPGCIAQSRPFAQMSKVFAAPFASEPLRILVVDDNAALRRLQRTMFEQEGYAVVEAAGQADVMKALRAESIALVTLDLALGSEDGLAIARAIRAKSDVPIIMVTAKGEDVERIVGLEVGADDYIVKPFNVREVLARVRAVLRRTGRGTPAVADDRQLIFRFEGLKLDPAARSLLNGCGDPVELTSREFRLLEAFVRRPARVLSRDALLDLLGTEAADEPLERAVDTLIGRLRRKIEPDVERPSMIKTVRGEGYVFAARVTVS